MLQVRVDFRKQILLRSFGVQRCYFGSSTTNEYLNSFHTVLQRFTQKFVSKQKNTYRRKGVEYKPLKKHTYRLRTILEKNRIAKLKVKELPPVTPETLVKHNKRTIFDRFGFLGELFSKISLWTFGLSLNTQRTSPLTHAKINYYPTKLDLRSKKLGLTQREEMLRASKNAAYLKRKIRPQNQTSVARTSNFVPIDLSKMKVSVNPAKGIQSARFVPLSKLIPQTRRSYLKNRLLRKGVSSNKVSRGPIKVKASSTCRIFVCQSTEQCDEAIQMLRKSIQGFVTPYLGFDTESTRYRLGSQVSVIQLASSNICVIFQVGHIYRSIGKIPASLRELLADPNILKTGVNVTGDAASLRKTYKLTCHGVINIDSIAQELGFKNLSLIDLVHKFGVNVKLDKSWRKKRWSRTHLALHEIDYAANDAIASFHLFNALIKRAFRTA